MSHDASVLRRSGSAFTAIPEGGRVSPLEPIRYNSDGGLNLGHVTFVVNDALSGRKVFEKAVTANPVGNAWVDTVAPASEGRYTLIAKAQTAPFLSFTHDSVTEFAVDVDAPEPPAPPPGSGSLLAGLGDLKTILIVAVVGFVALQAAQFLPKRRR